MASRYDGMRYAEAEREFQKSIKENQEGWKAAESIGDTQGQEYWHKKQEGAVAEWDAFTGGKSAYDSESGVWNFSDGTRTDGNGVTGNSYQDVTYNPRAEESSDDYDTAYDAYRANSFEYNPETDPLFQNYKRQYQRAGQKAMNDTVGQMAVQTGGMAGSYAATAGALAYNNYMEGLADKIPELEQLAHAKYQDEQNRYLQEIELAERQMERDEAGWENNKARIEKNEEELEADRAKQAYYDEAQADFKESGWGNLTEEQRLLIRSQGGWYDDTTGELVDAKGNRYKSDYDPVWSALFTFQQEGGFHAMSTQQKKALVDAGYEWRPPYWVDKDGNAYAVNPALA